MQSEHPITRDPAHATYRAPAASHESGAVASGPGETRVAPQLWRRMQDGARNFLGNLAGW
ncbi:MAG: hypothetical protein IBJ15_04910 [Alphaproteobacteria bacterium]|nr:hypothetical protein [Alphaproteobacteria bacterium]